MLWAAALAIAMHPLSAQPLILRGGTIIDVSNFGTSARDIADSVIVLDGGRVVSIGAGRTSKGPAGARVIDIRGKYVIPGLIDGFGALANQSFANAYLYMGVTSVVVPAEADPRRGQTFLSARPGPALYRLATLNSEGSEAGMAASVDRAADDGIRVLLLHYRFAPEHLTAVVRRARERGVATIGELGRSSYPEAIAAKVDSFVHTSRYSLPLAPAELREQVARAPFGPPRLKLYEFYKTVQPDSEALRDYASLIAKSGRALIPTLSLGYLEVPGHENPWKEPAARIIDPRDIHLPADPSTGDPPATASQRDQFPSGVMEAMLRNMDPQYAKAGARFLTGSGTSAFGTMPGISLHTEIALLHRIGLTNRQALAAATGNFQRIYPWPGVGCIDRGCRADLVVLDANPVENLANLKRIHAVFLGGEMVNRNALLN